MLILTIRTDKPEAEVGVYDDQQQLIYEVWEAHRRLAETLHQRIDELLSSQGIALHQLKGIVVYRGPGSFTGLRIGLSVANALAYSLRIPIVAETGTWIETGIAKLQSGATDNIALPEYGSPAHITTQKK